MFIAIYGTLRQGERAERLMQGIRPTKTDKVSGTLWNLGPYPGYRKQETVENQAVTVEIYEVSEDELLEELDSYEGFNPDNREGSLYLRETVVTESGLETDIYVYNSEPYGAVPISSGDWKNR